MLKATWQLSWCLKKIFLGCTVPIPAGFFLLDLAELVAMALGIPTVDQTPTVLAYMQEIARQMADSRMVKAG
ncbi:hypothetical protein [Neomoorella glycerini]|uniref:hypothetical protein n=1 Tax=Neomoorella glycerini TaxID=55779 RepID=UPI001B8BE7B0|nr:hypothetical protein [Moorella glycerini]